MILTAGILGLLYGFLRKGNLASVFKKRFRLPALLFISLGLEWLLSSGFINKRVESLPAYLILRTLTAIFQYGILLVFLYRNRFKPGMGCLMAGSLMNGLVICANHGRMPIGSYIQHFGAEAIANIAAVPHYFVAQGNEPLLFLADLIPFWTFGSYMISVGDILISIGMFRLGAYMSRKIIRKRSTKRTITVEHPADIGYTDGR